MGQVYDRFLTCPSDASAGLHCGYELGSSARAPVSEFQPHLGSGKPMSEHGGFSAAFWLPKHPRYPQTRQVAGPNFLKFGDACLKFCLQQAARTSVHLRHLVVDQLDLLLKLVRKGSHRYIVLEKCRVCLETCASLITLAHSGWNHVEHHQVNCITFEVKPRCCHGFHLP